MGNSFKKFIKSIQTCIVKPLTKTYSAIDKSLDCLSEKICPAKSSYLCYYIDFDYVGPQYKYPRIDDIVVLLDIDIYERYQIRNRSSSKSKSESKDLKGTLPLHLHDKLWFELSDWSNISRTIIGKNLYFVALAFPHDTQITDIFVCLRNFISNVCLIKYLYLKVDDDQVFTNNITDHKSLLAMDLKAFTFYTVNTEEHIENITNLAVQEDSYGDPLGSSRTFKR